MGSFLDKQEYVYLALFVLLLVILLMVAIYRCCVASKSLEEDVVVLNRRYYNQLANVYQQLELDKAAMLAHSVNLSEICNILTKEKLQLAEKVKDLGDDLSNVGKAVAEKMSSLAIQPTEVSDIVSEILVLQKEAYNIARASVDVVKKADQCVQTDESQARSTSDQMLDIDVQSCSDGDRVIR